MAIVGLDHVQVAILPGGEDAARRFYAGLMGMPEIPKPDTLAGRGGVWFDCGGGQQLHCGIEDSIAPSRRHPALRTDDLDGLRSRLKTAGFPIVTDDDLPGYRRFYTRDPFGNRIELLQGVSAPTRTLPRRWTERGGAR